MASGSALGASPVELPSPPPQAASDRVRKAEISERFISSLRWVLDGWTKLPAGSGRGGRARLRGRVELVIVSVMERLLSLVSSQRAPALPTRRRGFAEVRASW
jgi:hypothetical protein